MYEAIEGTDVAHEASHGTVQGLARDVLLALITVYACEGYGDG